MHEWPASPFGERKPFMSNPNHSGVSATNARAVISSPELMGEVGDRWRIRSRLLVRAGACLRRTVGARTIAAGLSGSLLGGNASFSSLNVSRIVVCVRGYRIVASLFQLDAASGAVMSAAITMASISDFMIPTSRDCFVLR
jgi:hypothetical protein